jgi:8-oxo-dGTP pyrophosphatase MutT (NUDIX family)
MRYEKSCGCLIYKKGESGPAFLLVKHRNGGHWSFPKGHVELGETERQTALRESFEETGLRVLIRKGFRETLSYSPARGISKKVVYFLAEYNGGSPEKQPEEILEIGFFSVEDARRRLTYDADKGVLEKAVAVLRDA